MTSNLSSTSSIPVCVAIVVTQLLPVFSPFPPYCINDDDNVELIVDDNDFIQLSALELTHDVEEKLVLLQALFVAKFDALVGEFCWADDVEIVEVEFLVEGLVFGKWMFIENEEVVDDDEEGLSAEAGKELTSTAESGVSARTTIFVALWLLLSE